MSKSLRFLVTRGRNEEVMAILVRECHPGLDGEVRPPQLIEHEGQQYALKRQWMPDVYVYSPSARKLIDDFLGNTPA